MRRGSIAALGRRNTRTSASEDRCDPSGGHEQCPEQGSFGVGVAANTRTLELESCLT